jgi:uncharacterized protein (TIGR02147 family)
MLSIYNYKDPIEYLESYINTKKNEDANFSVNSFSKTLGLYSPMKLVDVLNGKRKIKDKLTTALIEHTELDKTEVMYLQAIIARSKEVNTERLKMYDLIVEELRPNKKKSTSINYTENLDIFSDWIYTAILSMSELPNFELTVANIKNKLVKKLETKKVEEALFSLFQYGLLRVNDEGRIEKKYFRTTSKSGLKARDFEDYYSMICELAKETFDHDPSEIELNMFSFSIASEDISIAKEIICKCRNQLARLSENERADMVYQANLSLFPLTKKAD